MWKIVTNEHFTVSPHLKKAEKLTKGILNSCVDAALVSQLFLFSITKKVDSPPKYVS